MLVVVLAQLGPARLPAVSALGLDALRREVIVASGGLAKLVELAALDACEDLQLGRPTVSPETAGSTQSRGQRRTIPRK